MATVETFPFEKGRLYSRRGDIHAHFGGQQQGGISTPADTPYIFLFTGEAGEQHGYADGWDENGIFHYFGEGQKGDMSFSRGNLAIRDHAKNGRELLLFQLLGKGRPVRYLGTFACTSWNTARAPDTDGEDREAIVFHLIPDDVNFQESDYQQEDESRQSDSSTDMEALRRRALVAAQTEKSNSSSESKRTYYKRSKAVRDYVLARAGGICECCSAPAPFERKDGSSYLEPHHIQRRSDFGPDHPRWVAGICPNCHREVHFGIRGDELNSQLAETIGAIEDG